MTTLYGIHDPVTDEVTDPVKSESGAHGEIPVESASITCETLSVDEDEVFNGVVIYSDDTKITMIRMLAKNEVHSYGTNEGNKNTGTIPFTDTVKFFGYKT